MSSKDDTSAGKRLAAVAAGFPEDGSGVDDVRYLSHRSAGLKNLLEFFISDAAFYQFIKEPVSDFSRDGLLLGSNHDTPPVKMLLKSSIPPYSFLRKRFYFDA